MSKFYMIVKLPSTKMLYQRTVFEGMEVVIANYPQKHKEMFSKKEDASAVAKTLAARDPGSMVHIMEVSEVFEALPPTIISKAYNDKNELVPL